MTFQRISAATELISRYKQNEGMYESVIVIISFDLLSEMRAKCTKSMFITKDGQEYFMDCKIVMSKVSSYIAVAYFNNNDGLFHDIIEITDEVADGK